MGAVTGSLRIAETVTGTLQKIRKEQAAFRRDVQSTSKTMQQAWDKRREIRLNTSPAMKKLQQLNKRMQPLRKKVVTAFAVKDAATSKIKAVTGKVAALGKKVAQPLVKIRDKTKAALSKIGAGLKKIAKPVLIGVGVAAAGVAATAKSGMTLEQQQVGMEHFIGTTNKSMSQADVKKTTAEYIQQLRDNANATPFETGDVIAAGSRAVAIASGNTKEAMSLVTLAEDMAAASGGTKSISDAIEALADAKVGEMERLKEFGFKVSAEDFQSKGFGGVAADLSDFYGGAASKLATTGAGLASTIMGKLKSSVSDAGLKIVTVLKPTFESLIALIDKLSPVLERVGTWLADKVGRGLELVAGLMERLKPVTDALKSAFKALQPAFQAAGKALSGTFGKVLDALVPALTTIIGSVSRMLPKLLPIITTIVDVIGGLFAQLAPIISQLFTALEPVVNTLAPIITRIFGEIGDKLGGLLSFVGDQMGFVTDVISWAAPMIGDILSTAWDVIGPIMDVAINVFKVIFNVVKAVFPAIKKIIEVVWKVLKPIIQGIGKVLSGLAKGLGWIADKLGGGKDNKTSSTKGGKGGSGAVLDAAGGKTATPSGAGELDNVLAGLPDIDKVASSPAANTAASPSGGAAAALSGLTASPAAAKPADAEAAKQAAAEVKQANEAVKGELVTIGGHVSKIATRLTQPPKQAAPGLQRAQAAAPGLQPPGLLTPAPANAGRAAPRKIEIKIAKIADAVHIREEADIDKLSDKVAAKIRLVALNM